MAEWLQGIVTKRVDWNDHLFSLLVRCDKFPPYVAGQFTKLGLQKGQDIISRPYSLVSHPREKLLEVLAVPVEEGMLSPSLHKLAVDSPIHVMSPATGYLTLEEVPAAECLWLFATGTGVGPFISILRGSDAWQRYSKVVLVYAARFRADLAYAEEIQSWQQQYPEQFVYVPIVSRDSVAGMLKGRIPQLLTDKLIQRRVGQQVSAENSQVMLCGNPEMIKDAYGVLKGMGLTKHLRRSPGQISMERYW